MKNIKIINKVLMKEIKIGMVFEIIFETDTYYTFKYNGTYYSIYKSSAEIVDELVMEMNIDSNDIYQLSFNI